MRAACCAQEQRPSGDPNTRQQHPLILTRQDIRFNSRDGKGHAATGAYHRSLTQEGAETWSTYCDDTSRTLPGHVTQHKQDSKPELWWQIHFMTYGMMIFIYQTPSSLFWYFTDLMSSCKNPHTPYRHINLCTSLTTLFTSSFSIFRVARRDWSCWNLKMSSPFTGGCNEIWHTYED